MFLYFRAILCHTYISFIYAMSDRLKANQLKFDCHMTGMEETMRNIMKDGADVRLMRRGLVRPHTYISVCIYIHPFTLHA